MTYARDLHYNGSSAVLLRYEDGQPALWVTDEYLAGKSDKPGTYSLNDINFGEPLGADEDVDAAVAAWQAAVEWTDEPEVAS